MLLKASGRMFDVTSCSLTGLDITSNLSNRPSPQITPAKRKSYVMHMLYMESVVLLESL